MLCVHPILWFRAFVPRKRVEGQPPACAEWRRHEDTCPLCVRAREDLPLRRAPGLPGAPGDRGRRRPADPVRLAGGAVQRLSRSDAGHLRLDHAGSIGRAVVRRRPRLSALRDQRAAARGRGLVRRTRGHRAQRHPHQRRTQQLLRIRGRLAALLAGSLHVIGPVHTGPARAVGLPGRGAGI